MKRCIGLLLVTVLLASCAGEPTTATTPADEVVVEYQETEEAVVAEAVIEPATWSALGFRAGGEIVQVLVEEGDVVEAGDPLVRLDPTDAQLEVKRAEAALETAKAQLALLQAGSRPGEIAAAEAQLEGALATLEQASAQQDQLVAGATKAEIAAAEAQIASASLQQLVAQQTYDATDDSDKREKEEANYNLYAANEALAAAQAQLDRLLAGADANQIRAAQAGVSSAAAQQEAVQAQLNLLQAGAAPEEITVKEAEVRRTEVAVEVARATLAHTEIRAPFAGTVTAINVEVGNTANPGQIACVLAMMNQLQARTIDLTELDIGQVVEGQLARVTVDALPGREFTGVVRQIALQAEDFRGQMVYAVTVELTDVANAPLRWGMTAWVEFGAP